MTLQHPSIIYVRMHVCMCVCVCVCVCMYVSIHPPIHSSIYIYVFKRQQCRQWLDYDMDDRRIVVQFLKGTRDISVLQIVQIVSGANQPSIQWVPDSLPPEVKLSTHLHLVQRLRTRGSIPPLQHISSQRAHRRFHIYLVFTHYRLCSKLSCTKFKNVLP
jgi:hypothetical protein